jgi:hypothetical protein
MPAGTGMETVDGSKARTLLLLVLVDGMSFFPDYTSFFFVLADHCGSNGKEVAFVQTPQ